MSDRSIEEVQQVIHHFAGYWNRHDIAAFAQLFAHDAQFVNVVGIWWRGRKDIQAAHEFLHSGIFRNSHLRILESDIRLPAQGFALARCRWILEGHVTPDGTALPARDGLLFLVLRHEAGKWLIIDTQNTDRIEGTVSRPQ